MPGILPWEAMTGLDMTRVCREAVFQVIQCRILEAVSRAVRKFESAAIQCPRLLWLEKRFKNAERRRLVDRERLMGFPQYHRFTRSSGVVQLLSAIREADSAPRRLSLPQNVEEHRSVASPTSNARSARNTLKTTRLLHRCPHFLHITQATSLSLDHNQHLA